MGIKLILSRLLFLAILLAPIFSLSQGFIDKNEKEVIAKVKTSLADKIDSIRKSYSTEGTLILSWYNYYVKVTQAVYFNKGGFAVIEATIPDNVSALNSYVEFYDKMCAKVSSTEWKWYLAGKTYKIELLYSKKSPYYTFYLSLFD